MVNTGTFLLMLLLPMALVAAIAVRPSLRAQPVRRRNARLRS
jgi:hypothetical protein